MAGRCPFGSVQVTAQTLGMGGAPIGSPVAERSRCARKARPQAR
ncbi:MAG: hypothetical protein AVDCRST_MAG88-3815 [uncultured Thermomicrobiales bacterium]|uniref:Uncharacterized protein n=1 Tax=uncultured Thermomicrobiales bacterium TaxID=1645740 RepID=A0A6J4VPN8_9BACT|nr:MAG: hypothetical protein AVDCRST_MAG88-3815 [uncultured Thermomicrobiales bacterium]